MSARKFRYKLNKNCPNLTPEFIEAAKAEYLATGGRITKLEMIDSPEDYKNDKVQNDKVQNAETHNFLMESAQRDWFNEI